MFFFFFTYPPFNSLSKAQLITVWLQLNAQDTKRFIDLFIPISGKTARAQK